MNTKKAVLFIIYILLGLTVAGAAFSHFWRTRAELVREENQLNARSGNAPSVPDETTDQNDQSAVIEPETFSGATQPAGTP